MQYMSKYSSILGEITIACNDTGIIGLWFDGQKYFGSSLTENTLQTTTSILTMAHDWLDIYFSGSKPDFTPPLSLNGTVFQKSVWEILQQIPYGSVTTYGNIAHILAEKNNYSKMSAQAVGNAVGRNPISIIIPCHRVVGSKGSLTGYAGGIERKMQLLKLEKADTSPLFIPNSI